MKHLDYIMLGSIGLRLKNESIGDWSRSCRFIGSPSAKKLQGIKATVLEAGDRYGGRVLTDWSSGYAVELGAEFVHGDEAHVKDMEICKILWFADHTL